MQEFVSSTLNPKPFSKQGLLLGSFSEGCRTIFAPDPSGMQYTMLRIKEPKKTLNKSRTALTLNPKPLKPKTLKHQTPKLLKP